jgi:hypothetical protein
VGIRDYNAMLVSALCHLAAMIALGVLLAAGDLDSGRISLLADVADQPALLDDSPIFSESVEIEMDAAAAAMAGPVHLFDVSATATADLAPLDSLAEFSAVESGRLGKAFGALGDADGHFQRGAAEFFGVGGYGKSFEHE